MTIDYVVVVGTLFGLKNRFGALIVAEAKTMIALELKI